MSDGINEWYKQQEKIMYFYRVLGTRVDNGNEEMIECFEQQAGVLTASEARQCASESVLLNRKNKAYSSVRLEQKIILCS